MAKEAPDDSERKELVSTAVQDRQVGSAAAGTSAARLVSDGAVGRADAKAPGIVAGRRANPVQTASDRVPDPGQAATAPAQTTTGPDEAAASHASGREALGQAAQGSPAGLSTGHHAGGTNSARASHANGHTGRPVELLERAADEGAEDAAAALAAFRAAAERRGRQYGAFNAGFQRYLVERDESAFRRLMAETTAEFQAVNERVRGLEACLAGRLNRPDLAALLRAVQASERDVLRFTLVLQALKKAFSDGNFSWQRPDTDTSHADTDTSHADVSSERGISGRHDASGPSDSRCCAPAPEPTEAEYRAALAEATQALEAAAAAVADATEELRYEAAELAAGG